MSDDVIVAIGSVNDCELLVEKFAQLANASLNFGDFARVWKASNFELIFCGRSSEELPLLASELLAIAKSILLNVSHSFARRVGGLYLMYGLYFKQQSKSKIRFTLSEFKELMKFVNELKEKEIKEAQFIFQKLFIGKAFLFCACTTPNKYIQMNPKCLSEEEVDIGNSMDDNECRLIECESLSANSLRDVSLLHSKYEEIKAQLPGFITTTSSSAAPNKNFPTELRTTLDALKSDIAKNKGNGVEQEKSVNCAEEVNQGVIRRRIVNSSFQSESRTRRIPVDITSMGLAKKSSEPNPSDS